MPKKITAGSWPLKYVANIKTAIFISIILLAAIAAAGMTGCAGAGAIKPNKPNDVINLVKSELEQQKFNCKFRDERPQELFCQSNDTYQTLIKYYSQSRRLRFMAIFELKEKCAVLHPDIMDFNWNFNVAQVSCKDDTITFLSNSILPECGMSGEDIKSYLVWWSAAINDALKESGLWDKMR